MKRALAIETSGRIGSVALIDGDSIEEAEFPHGLKHAAGLIPLIDRLCRERNLCPTDLSELYVSVGPGSFTGLRIGITLAKTLAFATGAKLVAVPSMRVLVENASKDARHAIVVLDAKREQVFTARFERVDGNWLEREPAHLEGLASMLERSPRPVELLGEGIPYHQKFISDTDRQITIAPQDLWRARAGILARIGRQLAREGKFVDPFVLEPIYIRPPEAQEKFEAKQTSSERNTEPRR